MSTSAGSQSAASFVRWLNNQPYLLLSLTALFWAGNIVLARSVAGHVPPITLTCARWIGTVLVLLPFARPHLRKDWPIFRAHLPLALLLAATGFALNNVLSYGALQYTQALNALLLQSSTPLFIALWSLILFGVRLTWAQFAGITVSILGVLTIVLHGDFAALANIRFNKGDVMFTSALFIFGFYSALMPRRPVMHPLSFVIFITGGAALMLLPFSVWEFVTGFPPKADLMTMGTVFYTVIFASALAYTFFNRGIELIGPNRAAPFLHLVPVFGSVLAILMLGEQPELFHLIGYLMVLAGVIIASRRSSAKI